MALALFITNVFALLHTHQPISRNTLSESRNVNSFLASFTSNDRDRRWTARTVSTLVPVARESVLSRCSPYSHSRRLRWRSLSHNRYRACSLASDRRNLKPNKVPTDVVDCRTELAGCSRSGSANGEVSATALSRCGTVQTVSVSDVVTVENVSLTLPHARTSSVEPW